MLKEKKKKKRYKANYRLEHFVLLETNTSLSTYGVYMWCSAQTWNCFIYGDFPRSQPAAEITAYKVRYTEWK